MQCKNEGVFVFSLPGRMYQIPLHVSDEVG